jgi:putative ABC transport system permease protein
MSEAAVSCFQLGLAATLVCLDAGLSILLNLGLAKTLLIAGCRMVAQLLLVGLVLRYVFALSSPVLVVAVAVAMTAAASFEIYARQSRRFRGMWGFAVGAGSTGFAAFAVTALALAALRPSPWYSPEVSIPLVGIVLGSVMNGVSVSLNAFITGVVRERAAIEARLALGASAGVAFGPLQRGALRSGMIPIINQMSAAGLITLPGMMTGQILAGMPPFEAAKYQIFVLLLLAGGSGLGALCAVQVAIRRMTDGRERLRIDRVTDELGKS